MDQCIAESPPGPFRDTNLSSYILEVVSFVVLLKKVWYVVCIDLRIRLDSVMFVLPFVPYTAHLFESVLYSGPWVTDEKSTRVNKGRCLPLREVSFALYG